MLTSEFDYHLPPELIAQTPVEPRDASRLLVLDRSRDVLEHRLFRDILDYLRPGDLLVYPGHSWDELVGMRLARPPERLCFIYHVGAERSLQDAVSLTHRAIGRAFARGGRVFVARLRDRLDDQGFKEMGWFGLSRQGFAAIFAPYSPRATEVPDLWALSPPVTATARGSPSSRRP